jgi:lysophospholipase L1-like esterase
MRILVSLLILIGLTACGDDQPISEMLPSKSIYLFGDSISTDTPITYGRLLKDELAATLDIEIAGVGGNRIEELIKRLDRDIIPYYPAVLVIFVGINDAATHCNAPEYFTPAIYESLYGELLNRIKTKLPLTKIVLVTPGVIADPLLETLPATPNLTCLLGSISDYQAVVKSIAQSYQTDLIDYGDMLQHVMQTHLPSELSSDAIHPNQLGASFIKDLFRDKILGLSNP